MTQIKMCSLAAKHSASDFTSNNEQKHQHHHGTLEISVFSSLIKPRLSDSQHYLCFIVSGGEGGRICSLLGHSGDISTGLFFTHGSADSEISRVIMLYYYLCGVRAVMLIIQLSGRAVLCLLADASLAGTENLISSKCPQK